MTVEPKIALRLQFLARVVRKECQHLITTDQRLFGGFFTLEQTTRLEDDPDLAERVRGDRFDKGPQYCPPSPHINLLNSRRKF